MYGGDYAADYAEPVRPDEIWPASPGNDGHPDLPRQNPESGQNSVRRISASWIAAQKALDADNPDNRASGLEQRLDRRIRHRKSFSENIPETKGRRKLYSNPDSLRRQLRRVEYRRRKTLEHYFRASEPYLPFPELNLHSHQDGPGEDSLQRVQSSLQEELQDTDLLETGNEESTCRSERQPQPSVNTLYNVSMSGVSAQQGDRQMVGTGSFVWSEALDQIDRVDGANPLMDSKSSVESLRRTAAMAKAQSADELQNSSGNEMTAGFSTPAQCTPSPSPFKGLPERPTVTDSPGPLEPGVSRRRRKRLLPLVGYESSNKSEELVSTTGSLQERASHKEEEIKPIPISKVMKAWDSKAKKRDSGANSDVSDTSMFTFMVADRKRSGNETGATSEEDWDRPHFDSDTGEEQGMAGRGGNDPAAQARGAEPAEASYESSAPTPVPATPDQAVPSSFRTLEEPTGKEDNLLSQGTTRKAVSFDGQSSPPTSSSNRAGDRRSCPDGFQRPKILNTFEIAPVAETAAKIPEAVKQPSYLTRITLKSRKAWDAVLDQGSKLSPKQCAALAKSASFKSSFRKNGKKTARPQASTTEIFRVPAARQVPDPRYTAPLSYNPLPDGDVQSPEPARSSLQSKPTSPMEKVEYEESVSREDSSPRPSMARPSSVSRVLAAFSQEPLRGSKGSRWTGQNADHRQSSSSPSAANRSKLEDIAALQRKASGSRDNSLDSPKVCGTLLQTLETTDQPNGVPSPRVSLETLERLRSSPSISASDSDHNLACNSHARWQIASQRHAVEAAALSSRVNSSARRLLRSSSVNLEPNSTKKNGLLASCSAVLRRSQSSFGSKLYAISEVEVGGEEELVFAQPQSPATPPARSPVKNEASKALPLTEAEGRRLPPTRNSNPLLAEIQPDEEVETVNSEQQRSGWRSTNRNAKADGASASAIFGDTDRAGLRAIQDSLAHQAQEDSLAPATPTSTANPPLQLCIQRFSRGDKYEGQIGVASYSGFGTMTYRDGASYAGQWKEGRFNGYGKQTYAPQSSAVHYRGQFANHQAHGWGVCVYADGAKYSGQWHNGLQQGLGHQEATKSSGPFGYIGSFKEGLGQGIGIALFPDGEEYSGEIVESMPQGYGVARLRGRKGLYAGQWQGGTRHGWAVSTLLNGALWAGQWVYGRACWLADMSLIMDSDLADDVLEALDFCQEAANRARVAGKKADSQAKSILNDSGNFQGCIHKSLAAADKAAFDASKKAQRARRAQARIKGSKDAQAGTRETGGPSETQGKGEG